MESGERLITCILPKGRARPLVEVLARQLGVTRISVSHARGVGRLTPLRHRELGQSTEKEIVQLAVDGSVADELFEWIYFEAGINHPHGGLIYQQRLAHASPFILPELEEERS